MSSTDMLSLGCDAWPSPDVTLRQPDNSTSTPPGTAGNLASSQDAVDPSPTFSGNGSDRGPAVDPCQATVLIVDDEIVNIRITQKYLAQAGYSRFLTLTEGQRAAVTAVQHRPDVILLDIMMPDVSGLEVLRLLRSEPATKNVPVIILTASSDPCLKVEALQLGATDFLSKPVDSSELVLRIRNCVLAYFQQKQLKNYAQELERKVAQRTLELEVSRRHVIQCLAQAAEFRDDDTGQHILRVGRFAGVIARHLGYSDDYVELIEQAAQLHDVGKIALPDDILRKSGKLTPEEFSLVQRHCQIGRGIIEPMNAVEWSHLQRHAELGAGLLNTINSPVLHMASRIALTHHERWDGTGYPLGLAGEDIPVEGRITAVADVYDALSSRRAYKKPFPRQRCLEIMEEGRNSHFDPRMLDAFQAAREEIINIQMEHADPD